MHLFSWILPLLACLAAVSASRQQGHDGGIGKRHTTSTTGQCGHNLAGKNFPYTPRKGCVECGHSAEGKTLYLTESKTCVTKCPSGFAADSSKFPQALSRRGHNLAGHDFPHTNEGCAECGHSTKGIKLYLTTSKTGHNLAGKDFPHSTVNGCVECGHSVEGKKLYLTAAKTCVVTCPSGFAGDSSRLAIYQLCDPHEFQQLATYRARDDDPRAPHSDGRGHIEPCFFSFAIVFYFVFAPDFLGGRSFLRFRYSELGRLGRHLGELEYFGRSFDEHRLYESSLFNGYRSIFELEREHEPFRITGIHLYLVLFSGIRIIVRVASVCPCLERRTDVDHLGCKLDQQFRKPGEQHYVGQCCCSEPGGGHGHV
ncbi:hypothetical protein RQP46_009080 [Phenoliferia psychrophenolica]